VTESGGAAESSFVPHFPQKTVSAGFSDWHFEQRVVIVGPIFWVAKQYQGIKGIVNQKQTASGTAIFPLVQSRGKIRSGGKKKETIRNAFMTIIIAINPPYPP
jgi:hypothetical protein